MAPRKPRKPRSLVLDDLPDNALAMVLGGLPTIEELCQACCVSTSFRTILYAEHGLWSELCTVRPMDMTSFEIDCLVKRALGKLRNIKLVLYKEPDPEDPPSDDDPILYDTGTRGEWVEALQSLTANKALQSIEFVDKETYIYDVRLENYRSCVTAALDALCAISGELPLSLKKISIASLEDTMEGANDGGLRWRHIRTLEAAPCVAAGCELDLMACADEECKTIQSVESCCICKERIPCMICLEKEDELAANSIEDCSECSRTRCWRVDCQDALEFHRCEGCWSALSCGTCVDKRGKCDACATSFCARKHCVKAHKASCAHDDCEWRCCRSNACLKLHTCKQCKETLCPEHGDLVTCEGECRATRCRAHGELVLYKGKHVCAACIKVAKVRAQLSNTVRY